MKKVSLFRLTIKLESGLGNAALDKLHQISEDVEPYTMFNNDDTLLYELFS